MPKVDDVRAEILLAKEKKFNKLESDYQELLADNRGLTEKMQKVAETDIKFKKIVDGEYGDSIVFLGIQWSSLAWKLNISPEGGETLINSIKGDVRALIKSLLIKKEKVKPDASKKRATKQT